MLFGTCSCAACAGRLKIGCCLSCCTGSSTSFSRGSTRFPATIVAARPRCAIPCVLPSWHGCKCIAFTPSFCSEKEGAEETNDRDGESPSKQTHVHVFASPTLAHTHPLSLCHCLSVSLSLYLYLYLSPDWLQGCWDGCANSRRPALGRGARGGAPVRGVHAQHTLPAVQPPGQAPADPAWAVWRVGQLLCAVLSRHALPHALRA